VKDAGAVNVHVGYRHQVHRAAVQMTWEAVKTEIRMDLTLLCRAFHPAIITVLVQRRP